MTANCARTAAYTLTEVLHYEDGSTLKNGPRVVRREPSLAVSRLARSGSTFDFWNGHDPRITGVEFIYEPA